MMFGKKKTEESKCNPGQPQTSEEVNPDQKEKEEENPETAKETEKQCDPKPEEKMSDMGTTESQSDTDSPAKPAASQGQSEAAPQREDTLSLLQEIGQKLDGLENTFMEKLMRTAQEEKIIDSMHEELQKYRADLYASLLRPVLSELCGIRDNILRNKAFYEEKAEKDGEAELMVPFKLLVDYAYEIQDLLQNNDVFIYRTKAGAAFDPTKHRVTRKVETPEKELHGKIVESQSAGYLYCGKTLSPEKVAVYYYKKPEENVETTKGGHN